MKDIFDYNGERHSKKEMKEYMHSLIDSLAQTEDEIMEAPFDMMPETAIRLAFSHIIVSEEVEKITKMLDEEPSSHEFAAEWRRPFLTCQMIQK